MNSFVLASSFTTIMNEHEHEMFFFLNKSSVEK